MESKTKAFFKKPIMLTVIAIVLGFITAMIIMAAAGYPPFESIGTLLYGMLGSPKKILNVFIKSTPIIFTGVGVAFAIKTGLFNIGAEGQFIMGSIGAVLTGILVKAPAVIEIPLIILAGAAAGALYGGIVGLLKARFGINEVITSIMLNWIALYFSNWIVGRPQFAGLGSSSQKIAESGYTTILDNWKRTAGMEGLMKTLLGRAFLKTDVNVGFIVAVIAAIFISWLLFKTRKGFELRAVGFNKDAAKFTGINVNRQIVQAMLISGALCGIGAAFYITGQWPHAISSLSNFEGYGLNGLSVAFIAMSSPIGCIFAGLLFGGLLYGGSTLQLTMGVPTEIINIIIGVIVFFCALTYILPKLIDKIGTTKKGGAANV
ncbi:MAG TPA: ABC transporter permease [Lachnospiraceae bacterium]|nr:ABC transporter permease [Lachnospiraceae bacterium]